MQPLLDNIDDVLKSNQWRILTTSRDRDGVPNIAPEFALDVNQNEIVFAKFPKSETLDNIAACPNTAVCVIDWKNRRGFQIKGTARAERADRAFAPRNTSAWNRLRAAGATWLIRVAIEEIYDIKPSDGLGRPLWTSKRLWRDAKHAVSFERPTLEPLALDLELTARVALLNKRILESRTPAFLATVDHHGVPNISPRFMLDFDGNGWLYGDAFKNKTFINAARPSPLAVAIIDWDAERGFQAKGWSEPKYRGDWIIRVRDRWQQIGFDNQLVQAVLFHPAELHELRLGLRRELQIVHERNAWVNGHALAA